MPALFALNFIPDYTNTESFCHKRLSQNWGCRKVKIIYIYIYNVKIIKLAKGGVLIV